MTLEQLTDYVEARPALIKLEATFELMDGVAGFHVTKTKETFSFGDEDEADTKIDEIRQTPGFLGVDKKYKKGKINKSGEVVTPETWQIIAKLSH